MRAGLPSRACRVSRRMSSITRRCIVNGASSRRRIRPARDKARDVQEHVVDVGAERGIGRQQPEIGVEARRARMVVAGAEVRVGPQAHAPARIGLAPDHERQLGVRLEAEHAVDDLRAGVLQPLRPVDVRLLVEARHQLDHDRHFLAAARRLDQRLHQHRVDAGAVDGLLDRDDVGILGRAADELDDRLERLVGMVQQDVARADRREDVRLLAQPVRDAGHERLVLQRVDVDLVGERGEARDVDRAVAAVQVGVGRDRTAAAGTARAAPGSWRRPRAAPPSRTGAAAARPAAPGAGSSPLPRRSTGRRRA